MSESARIALDKVRHLIEKNEFSKTDICRSAGFSKSQLDDYLKGLKTPGLEALDRLAKAVERDAWDLIKPEDESIPEGKRELIRAILGMNDAEMALAADSIRALIDSTRRFHGSQDRKKVNKG